VNSQALLLISRRDLLKASEGNEGERVIRALAALTRQGFHLVATASQPHEWSRRKAESKRSRRGPRRLRDRLTDAGGVLDGVYYIPHSLLTQRARREEAIRDLLGRFGSDAAACYLLSSNRKFIATAENLGLNTREINANNALHDILLDLAGSGRAN